MRLALTHWLSVRHGVVIVPLELVGKNAATRVDDHGVLLFDTLHAQFDDFINFDARTREYAAPPCARIGSHLLVPIQAFQMLAESKEQCDYLQAVAMRSRPVSQPSGPLCVGQRAHAGLNAVPTGMMHNHAMALALLVRFVRRSPLCL